jgi:hypothetical protein
MLQYKASVLLAGHYYRRHHWMLLDGTRRIQESSRFFPSSLDTHPQSEDSGAFANFDELVTAIEAAEIQDADGGESDVEGEELGMHEEALARAEVDLI